MTQFLYLLMTVTWCGASSPIALKFQHEKQIEAVSALFLLS